MPLFRFNEQKFIYLMKIIDRWPLMIFIWFVSQYTCLPGIIGDRFFGVLDLNNSGYVDLKEFVHGFFKIYYSDTETKLKFAFDM